MLFLDEPTIGLDVVAQHTIQVFLREYQQRRKVTILLTSHYMKDVAALCRRVVIIAMGRIIYDGSLSGIVDRFSSHKVISLELANGEMPGGFERYGEVLSIEPPKIKMRVARGKGAGRVGQHSCRPLGGRRERGRPAAGRSDSGNVHKSKDEG